MRLERYVVPVGKTVVIGHNNHSKCDVIGFIEPAGAKMVNLNERVFEEYADDLCRFCEKRFKESEMRSKYANVYIDIFKVHPEFLIQTAKELDFVGFLEDTYLSHFLISYFLRGNITIEQFVNKLFVFDPLLYERFVICFCDSYRFHNFLNDTVLKFIYHNYDKCKGFVIEHKCKLQKSEFQTKKIECNHNDLLLLESLEDDDFFIFDLKSDNALAMPNVYSNGTVCWGSYYTKKPKNLVEMLTYFFAYPFNGDLVWDTSDSVRWLIDGYGFYEYDFFDNDYDSKPHDPTAREIIEIIAKGGNGNCYKGDMNVDYVEFDIEGVREILIVKNGLDLDDFNESIDEDFLNCLTDHYNDVFIFLINEKKENVWDAYLPTSEVDGIYIEINLQTLEDSNETN